MTYQEKRSYIQFMGNIIGFIIYMFYLVSETKGIQVGMIEFGKYVLLLVPALAIVQIIVKIIFDTLNRTREKKEDENLKDELDYMIELKSLRNFCFAFLASFFITLSLFWLGVSMITCLYVMVSGIFVAGNVIELSYIYYYRVGS